MKKSHTLPAFLALALAVTVALPATWAYFTANARASGGRTVQITRTGITEEFANWNKEITITCTSGTQPVYVRARAFSTCPLEYSGDGWTLNEADGWYYYAAPLIAQPAGGTMQAQANVLNVKIQIDGLPEGETPEDFDVAVVYETAPVYDENGNRCENPRNANWNRTLTTENGKNGGAAE